MVPTLSKVGLGLVSFAVAAMAIPTINVDHTSIHQDQMTLSWTPFKLPDGDHWASVSIGCRAKGYDPRCKCEDRPADQCERGLYTIGHDIDTTAGQLSWSPKNMKRSLSADGVALKDLTLHFTVVKREGADPYIQHSVPFHLEH